MGADPDARTRRGGAIGAHPLNRRRPLRFAPGACAGSVGSRRPRAAAAGGRSARRARAICAPSAVSARHPRPPGAAAALTGGSGGGAGSAGEFRLARAGTAAAARMLRARALTRPERERRVSLMVESGAAIPRIVHSAGRPAAGGGRRAGARPDWPGTAFVRGPPRMRSRRRRCARPRACQFRDLLARQLYDPCRRPFMRRPGLNVPIVRIVERQIARVQFQAQLPARQQSANALSMDLGLIRLLGPCRAA